jgi:hypothetical protein
MGSTSGGKITTDELGLPKVQEQSAGGRRSKPRSSKAGPDRVADQDQAEQEGCQHAQRVEREPGHRRQQPQPGAEQGPHPEQADQAVERAAVGQGDPGPGGGDAAMLRQRFHGVARAGVGGGDLVSQSAIYNVGPAGCRSRPGHAHLPNA